jgi:hypothetical protein
MTDTELKDGWGEPDPPSPTTRATARAALMREIAASRAEASVPRRWGRRLGWLVGGTVVTAAVAVVFSLVQPGQPAPPRQHGAQSSPSLDELSGQQILLQAADVAQTQPEGTGAYWHVEQEIPVENAPKPRQRYNDWTARDGVVYSMPDSYPGVSRITVEVGFPVGGVLLTLERVEGLPTDPDKLKKWMTDTYLRRNSLGEMATLVPFGLAHLLFEVPAPPAVRSAALRALATMPNVTNLGAADGGQALRVVFEPMPADKFPGGQAPPGTGEMTLVINPDTAKLISYTTYQGTTKVLAAGWTDDMPPIVPFH